MTARIVAQSPAAGHKDHDVGARWDSPSRLLLTALPDSIPYVCNGIRSVIAHPAALPREGDVRARRRTLPAQMREAVQELPRKHSFATDRNGSRAVSTQLSLTVLIPTEGC